MRAIDAVVFDFDGLILDTEMPSYLSWAEVFGQFGCELTEDDHASTIGAQFDRMTLLRARAARPLPPDDEVRAIKQRRHVEQTRHPRRKDGWHHVPFVDFGG